MKTAQEIIRESDERDRALRCAITELDEFEIRYEGFGELALIFNAIDTVKMRRPQTPKTPRGRFVPAS